MRYRIIHILHFNLFWDRDKGVERFWGPGIPSHQPPFGVDATRCRLKYHIWMILLSFKRRSSVDFYNYGWLISPQCHVKLFSNYFKLDFSVWNKATCFSYMNNYDVSSILLNIFKTITMWECSMNFAHIGYNYCWPSILKNVELRCDGNLNRLVASLLHSPTRSRMRTAERYSFPKSSSTSGTFQFLLLVRLGPTSLNSNKPSHISMNFNLWHHHLFTKNSKEINFLL